MIKNLEIIIDKVTFIFTNSIRPTRLPQPYQQLIYNGWGRSRSISKRKLQQGIKERPQMQLRKEMSMSLRRPLTNESGEENASWNMVYDIFFLNSVSSVWLSSKYLFLLFLCIKVFNSSMCVSLCMCAGFLQCSLSCLGIR